MLVCAYRVTSPKGAKTRIFYIFSTFLGPGTGSSLPEPSPGLEVQFPAKKCAIWMRICRVMTIFVVFEKFGTVLRVLELFCSFWKLNFQAVIKSAASAASPIAWGEPRSRRPPAEAVALALPCNSQAVGEAALAADLITA